MSTLASCTRGEIFVETLIAIVVPIYFMFSTWALVDMFTAQLIVKHAAVVAARAAVVVGPDDPRFYNGQAVNDLRGGLRLADVTSAASLVIGASPYLQQTGFEVRLQPDNPAAGQMLTATVNAAFPCFSGWANVACGGQATRTLTASASFPYQGAGFPYDD